MTGSEALGGKVVDLPRGPGRPPGGPKYGGRPKGAKNKRTIEAEAFFRTSLPAAKRRLKDLIASKDEATALQAVKLVWAYTFGKPVDRREVTGAGGVPLVEPTRRGELLTTMEMARQILFTLRMSDAAAAELDEIEARTTETEPEPSPEDTAVRITVPAVAP